MRLRLAIIVLAAAAGGFSAAPVAFAAKRAKHHATGPTAKQIRAAVAKAKHSPDLWATVNQCTSSTVVPPGDVVGIRGQMPSLGFTTKMSMNFSVDFWNYIDQKFEPAKASDNVLLGKGTHGNHQIGVSFPFTPPTPPSTFLVRGEITFEWTLGAKVIASVVRKTGHGYANVGFSNPPGLSAGTCTLT